MAAEGESFDSKSELEIKPEIITVPPEQSYQTNLSTSVVKQEGISANDGVISREGIEGDDEDDDVILERDETAREFISSFETEEVGIRSLHESGVELGRPIKQEQETTASHVEEIGDKFTQVVVKVEKDLGQTTDVEHNVISNEAEVKSKEKDANIHGIGNEQIQQHARNDVVDEDGNNDYGDDESDNGGTKMMEGDSTINVLGHTGPSANENADDDYNDAKMMEGDSTINVLGHAGPSNENDSDQDDGDDDSDDANGAEGGNDASKTSTQKPSTGGNSYLDAEEYAYTRREEFTSEIYKIEISNLPRTYGFKAFRKLLNKTLGEIRPVKIKLLPRKQSHAFVTFRNEEDRRYALNALNGVNYKGKVMQTKLAKALPDPVAVSKRIGNERKRRIEEAAEKNLDAKRAKGNLHDQPIDFAARLNDSVTPFWRTPYPQQIETKNKTLLEFMKKLTRRMKDMCELKVHGNWVEESSEVNNGLCCKLEPCLESPAPNGYRNKCEFTIAEGPDGEKTVGFRVGSYREGYSGVVEPSQCIHISDKAKQLAAVFQKYIRQSPLPVYDLCFHTGYWQTLTVRSSVYGESMAIIQWSPQTMTQSEINTENENIKKFFVEGEGRECNLTSLYSQPNNTRAVGCHAPAPLVFLHGEKIMHEVLCGVKFRISPNAFFQVNTLAAQIMLDLVKKWLGPSKDATLLDICCGTGSIGLCLAKHVEKVIGIEMVKSAVDDAQQNATDNDISNAEYICGKVEDVFSSVPMKRLRRQKCIGILDPPRAGVHQNVIHIIRKYIKMDKLIYISCNAEMAMNNLLDLCRPTSKRNRTLPFRLVTAFPIDLFPHTKQVELCMLFERDRQSFDAVQYYKFFY